MVSVSYYTPSHIVHTANVVIRTPGGDSHMKRAGMLV